MKKQTYKELQEEKRLNHLDLMETLAEEIRLVMNLKAEVDDNHINIETIAGTMKLHTMGGDLMVNFYSFIYQYGLTLTEYGRKQRIKEWNNEKK